MIFGRGLAARLLIIYLTEDAIKPESSSQEISPKDYNGWVPALEEQDEQLGLEFDSDLEKYVHKLFLVVRG